MADKIKTPECGAISVFQGITRNNFNGKSVKLLSYESHESMALKELKKLGEKAVIDYKLEGCYICHRLGEVVSFKNNPLIANR